MRVVVDTNVLISGLLSGQGAPATILRLALHGEIELIFSPQTVQEHWLVVHYPKILKRLEKLGISIETAERALRSLVEMSSLVPGKDHVDVIADNPSDNVFLACAVEGKADVLVSGDNHLKQLKSYQNIQIVDPAHFLDLIKKRMKIWSYISDAFPIVPRKRKKRLRGNLITN